MTLDFLAQNPSLELVDSGQEKDRKGKKSWLQTFLWRKLGFKEFLCLSDACQLNYPAQEFNLSWESIQS